MWRRHLCLPSRRSGSETFGLLRAADLVQDAGDLQIHGRELRVHYFLECVEGVLQTIEAFAEIVHSLVEAVPQIVHPLAELMRCNSHAAQPNDDRTAGADDGRDYLVIQVSPGLPTTRNVNSWRKPQQTAFFIYYAQAV